MISPGDSRTYDSFFVNLFHVTHETSRLEAVVLLVWIYIAFGIREPNISRHLSTVKLNILEYSTT